MLEALAGLAVVQAAWKPAPDQNSIWQIVDHLTASKVWQIDMLENGQAASPVWTQPAGDESTWQAAVTQLKDAHTRLKVTLGQLSEEELLTSQCASGSRHDWNSCFLRQPMKRITVARSTI